MKFTDSKDPHDFIGAGAEKQLNLNVTDQQDNSQNSRDIVDRDAYRYGYLPFRPYETTKYNRLEDIHSLKENETSDELELSEEEYKFQDRNTIYQFSPTEQAAGNGFIPASGVNQNLFFLPNQINPMNTNASIKNVYSPFLLQYSLHLLLYIMEELRFLILIFILHLFYQVKLNNSIVIRHHHQHH